jgi:hypothetical protein
MTAMAKPDDSVAKGKDQGVPTLASELASDPQGEKLLPGLTESVTKREPVRIAIESLRHEMTDEEKAEEHRRWKAIRSGLHPETGKRLKLGDEKTLRPAERLAVRMERESNMMRYGTPYPSAYDLAKMNALERERVLTGIYRTPYSDLTPQLYRASLPHFDAAARRDPIYTFSARQALMDTVFSEAARAYDRMDQVERQRRFLDPLLDSSFVNRITGGLSPDLMYRATELHESEALRALREQVDRAASDRIMHQWQQVSLPQWHAALREAELAFARDTSLALSEAQRMLSVYGPTIAEQGHFLTEYRSNLLLFQGQELTAPILERAELLARVALPAALAGEFDPIAPINADLIRAYWKAALDELEADFSRDENPVFAWEAFAIARNNGLEVPEWVMEHLEDVADRLMAIRQEVADGKAVKKETDRVGKALGFGKKSAGRVGFFEHSTKLERDREIYFKVTDWLNEEKKRWPDRLPKRTSAYEEVAASMGLDRSTVQRSYSRVGKLRGEPEEGEEAE